MNGPPDIIQPPPLDVQTIHKSVIDMFPELDLTKTLKQHGHLASEALASVILDSIKNIPRKRVQERGQKRKASEINLVNLNPASVSSEGSFNSENSEEIGKLLIDKMLWDMSKIIKYEFQNSKQLSTEGVNFNVLKNAMADHFPLIRLEFITKILSTFNGAIFPASLACFFIENNFADKLRKVLPNFSLNFWLRAISPLMKNRTKKLCHNLTDNFLKQYKLFIDLLTSYRDGEYSALITTDLKLSKQYHQIEWQRPTNEERIECLVCFDLVPFSRVIFCNAPIQSSRDFLVSQLAVLDNFNEPGPSSAIYEELQRIKDQKEKENSDPQVHAFCKTCVRGSASAAVGEVPMAKGGIGLRCMVPDCENPILYSEIRILLKSDVRKKLDERIVEENLGMASLTNLERCKKCNFAIEMEDDKNINKVFDCLDCGYKMCRLCERDWDDEHFGITCKELDEKNSKDKIDRALEKQMNEAVIRKCPRCGIQFVKEVGCNKMTCRCGMKQCYICRESGIGYDHFCPHIRDPLNPNCKECKRTCLLHEDPKKKDEQLIKEIREKGVQNLTTTNDTFVQPTAPPATAYNAPFPNVAFVPPRIAGPWMNHNQQNNQERNQRFQHLDRERAEQVRINWQQHIDDMLRRNIDALQQQQPQNNQNQPQRQIHFGDQREPVRGQVNNMNNAAFPPYQQFMRAGQEFAPAQPAPNQAVNPRLYEQRPYQHPQPVFQQPHPQQPPPRQIPQPPPQPPPQPAQPPSLFNIDFRFDDYLGGNRYGNFGGVHNMPNINNFPQQPVPPHQPPYQQQIPPQRHQLFPQNIADNFIDRYLGVNEFGNAFQGLNNNGAPNNPVQID